MDASQSFDPVVDLAVRTSHQASRLRRRVARYGVAVAYRLSRPNELVRRALRDRARLMPMPAEYAR